MPKLRATYIRVGDIMKLVAIYKVYNWTRPIIDEGMRLTYIELHKVRLKHQHAAESEKAQSEQEEQQ